MPPLELQVALTSEARDEGLRLVREIRYFGHGTFRSHIVGSVMGLIFSGTPVLLGAFVAIRAVMRGTPDRTSISELLGFILIPISCCTWLIFRIREDYRKRASICGVATFTLSDQGINAVMPDGSTFSDPWLRYSGFHTGPRVLVCTKADRSGFLTIPIAELSPAVLEQVRSALRGRLPELSRPELRRQLRARNW